MQSQKHLWTTCSVLLIAALLAACGAPAAAPSPTPVPPTPTPIPPTPTPVPPEAAAPDPVAVVQAWHDALNNGDLDGVLALMTEDAKISDWKPPVRNVLDWWIDIKTHYSVQDCQQDGEQLACDVIMTDDGCITASGNTHGLQLHHIFSMQDGKIHEVSYGEVANTEDWDRYWEWLEGEGAWASAYRAEELSKTDRNVSSDAGEVAIKLCQDYADFLERQVPVITASAQGLVDAINSGDFDATVALLTDDAEVTFRNDTAAGKDQLSSLVNWLAGKETQYQITDCVWQGDRLVCSMSVVDGCIAASGAPEGLPGMMIVNALEDGTLRNVVSVLSLVERKPYETWLEAEAAWASANRADELAQAEGYSKEAGAMAVKLCQEYAAAAKLDDTTAAKIEAIVETAMTDYPTPGFEMCVVKDGQVVYNEGFGMADVEGDRPMTPSTVSSQASISKSLTAMAVMQLVEQGKIDLDAPVTAYLPYFTMADPRYEAITVRMLLSHMAGLPEVPIPWDVPLDPAIDPLEQAVRSLSDQQLISAPAEAWNYSGWGYSALGDIIAKVSGEPFASYMQQHLLEPMGMVNSTFVADEVDPDLRVTGYISAEDGSAAAIEIAGDARDLPADGLWSNCEDMTQWAQFMLNKGELNGTRVLQPESIDALWTSEAGTYWMDALGPWYGPYVGEYGLGWYVGEKAGHRLAGHAGANDGVNTHIQFAPDDGLAVIAIDNWLKPDPDWYPAGFAAFDVMDLLLGLQPDEEPAATLDDATVAQIETLVGEIMASGQVPGAAVGIVKDGELVYAKGFGVTELGGDEPLTADTIFHMGSVAKTATAVAIMQLVEAGKIDLDAPLTEYLPDFTLADPDLGEVTIRRLLSHTAGMPDPIDWLAEYQDENLRSDDAALDDYVRSLGDQSLTYQPGEDWDYSNTGFDILGDVVATVSGQSFEDYLQANVLTPLGMANSSYLLSDLDPAQLAAPHMYDENGNAKTLDFYPYSRAHAPSGAFYSSVNDMARFAIANLNQGELDGTQVLPASAYDEMWAPQAASTWAEAFGPQVTNYGLGWWVGEFNGHPIIGNYGTEFGFQSHLGMFPDDGMAVIALVNLFDPEAGSFYAYDIGNGVAEVLLGVEAEPATQP